MTDSAKQDAAAQPAAKAQPGAKAQPATAPVDPDAAASAASAPSVAPSADGATDGTQPGDEATPPLDDVKAKFREALDRKRQVHAEGQGKGGHEAGKVNGAHGPAASRRSFRRKSG